MLRILSRTFISCNGTAINIWIDTVSQSKLQEGNAPGRVKWTLQTAYDLSRCSLRKDITKQLQWACKSSVSFFPLVFVRIASHKKTVFFSSLMLSEEKFSMNWVGYGCWCAAVSSDGKVDHFGGSIELLIPNVHDCAQHLASRTSLCLGFL